MAIVFFPPPSIKFAIVYLTGARYGETFRLELNQSWEAIDIQTGVGVVIPKGSHKAVRILHRMRRDEKEEPWLVVTVQHKGKPLSAGLREAYWRQWEGHYIPELRVTIEEWKENAPPSHRKTRP
jgi:hypothetical protein